MRTCLIRVIFPVLMLICFSSTAMAQTISFFTVTGDVDVEIEAATATMTKIAGRFPAITIISTAATTRKLGGSHSVNLFFSNDFSAKPGSYPIRFSYRKQANTLGGSVMMPGNRFSHDTVGTAYFLEFGEQVKVQFEFKTFNKSEGVEGRQSITIKGEAICDRVDIF